MVGGGELVFGYGPSMAGRMVVNAIVVASVAHRKRKEQCVNVRVRTDRTLGRHSSNLVTAFLTNT